MGNSESIHKKSLEETLFDKYDTDEDEFITMEEFEKICLEIIKDKPSWIFWKLFMDTHINYKMSKDSFLSNITFKIDNP